MPPKGKGAKKPVKDTTVRIDPNKHAAQLKEIEESQRQYKAEQAAAAAAAAAAAEEEEEMDSEEMGSEEEEMYYSDIEPSAEIGRIDISFPETTEEFENSKQCYPPSYYTVSAKERLLLLFAENFRHQFFILYPKRRPLVLALRNECYVEKFVCSTIRPTAFMHIPLIGSVEGCASFVADFIIYEPPVDVKQFPTRLVSPATLLRCRHGNSFEMATLLCSMLIGSGYPAVVVSGVARSATVLNDMRNVPYPYEIGEVKPADDEEPKPKTGQKYKLRPMPDLESHLEENMAEVLRQKEEAERKQREEILRRELEELELVAVDRYHYRRNHAWVAIIENAPWSIKPRETYVNEDGDTVEKPPSAYFIEPTTGLICQTRCTEYILIDSVWNQYNYYVNMQTYQRVSEIRWDLRNVDDWEHLLPGEPPEMRTHVVFSDENLVEAEPDVLEEKQLDTIRSWVGKLHIGCKEFEERFPKQKKKIHYKRTIEERFSPYSQYSGKVKQLTLFEDDEYTKPMIRWQYFENRTDFLQQIKLTHATSRVEESFAKCRPDDLKYMDYNQNPSKPKFLYFYSKPRIDSLRYLEVYPERISVYYDKRSDRCYYRDYEFKATGTHLKKIVEKFSRNPDKNVPANKDVAVRTFLLSQRQILLKFHYAHGALTASTIDFIKPPKPDYGQELIFDPTVCKGYKANVNDPDPTPLELYKLLLAQLDAEEKAKKEFERFMEEISVLMDLRKSEMHQPVLKFHIFDPLRNGGARTARLKAYEEEEEFKREMSTKPADFLAPYLVSYKHRKLTKEESWAAYHSCLTDLKNRFVALLNDLQRQYEDLTAEATSLKRFLDKFEDQFNNFDYRRLVKEGKDIELHKRMVQQRLALTHEKSQKKYEEVKESLKNDPRLNL